MTIEVIETKPPTITITIDLDTARRLKSYAEAQAKRTDDYTIVNMLDSIFRWVEASEKGLTDILV